MEHYYRENEKDIIMIEKQIFFIVLGTSFIIAGASVWWWTNSHNTPHTPHAALYEVPDAFKEAHAQYIQGDLHAAQTLYKKQLRKHSSLVTLLTHFANTLSDVEEFEHAILCFNCITSLYPEYPSAHACLGVTYNKMEEPAQAIAPLKKAIECHPQYCDAYLQLSKAHYELEQFEPALTNAQQALELQPDSLAVNLHIGDVCIRQGNPEQACVWYERAEKLDPNSALAYYDSGYALMLKGSLKESLEHFTTAVKLNPNYHDAHLGLAFTNWALDDWQTGFEEYEWRWKPGEAGPNSIPLPVWDGSDLKGKTILLYSEQGMGDTMQFIRYAKMVKKQGARVVCGVQEPLITLLSSCPFIDELRTEYTFEGIDVQAPIMSLPRIFKTTAETIPTDFPYLQADKKLIEKWRTHLAQDKNFKVGLCWHVDPKHEKIKTPVSRRSVSLQEFAPFAAIEGVSFYSLQKVNGMDQLNKKPEKLVINTFGDNFDTTNGSFMDSAAIIESLDLVISVDSAIAHLTGALNKPVWVLLPYAPDGRWQLERSDTQWYPTMKLFRQPKPFDWHTTVQKITLALRKKVQG